MERGSLLPVSNGCALRRTPRNDWHTAAIQKRQQAARTPDASQSSRTDIDLRRHRLLVIGKNDNTRARLKETLDLHFDLLTNRAEAVIYHDHRSEEHTSELQSR